MNRPRPLGFAQIDKADSAAAERLAADPEDQVARYLLSALATLRAQQAREEAEEDAASLAAYEATKGEEEFPSELVHELISGANKLRTYRKYRGHTLADLAALSGLSVSYISTIERGVRDGSLAALRKLARALDIDLDDLI